MAEIDKMLEKLSRKEIIAILNANNNAKNSNKVTKKVVKKNK